MNKSTSIVDLLRDNDRASYSACLYLPEDKRESIAALWAFNNEVSRIRDLVSEPLPGEIRLQWWRDVLTGVRLEEGMQHPLGAVLLDAIDRYGLSQAAFDGLCEARIFDLYNDPMPTRTDLEGYLGETRSVLFQMAVQILNDGKPVDAADAAGHGGVAVGIADLLCQMAWQRGRGQCFVPQDILMAAGLSVEKFLAIDEPRAASGAVAALTAMGADHLKKSEVAIGVLDKKLRAAFVPLGLCRPTFSKAAKMGGSVALEPLTLSPLTAQWHLLRRSMKL